MTTKNRQLALQWAQLTALAAVHFLADVFPGMMHSVLPGIQAEFGLSIVLGGVLLGVFNFSSNWGQVFTGHMRPERTTPLFMYLGLMFAALICLLAVLPREADSFGLMLVLAVVGGGGVAIIHPEALRAIHALDRISPATSTAVFMIGGILGFALGGKYCTELVAHFGGVKGLFPLAACPILCIPIVLFLRVRLAVEPAGESNSHNRRNQSRLSFWPIMLMATLAGISTCTIVWIVPQKLALDGFELTFGGYSVMMFSLGGGAGAFFWAMAANRFGDLLCTLVSILFGVFLMAGYSVLISHRPAAWLFFAASFCAFGSYPLTVSIARGTSGPRLGRRMALMVGGTWGIASLFPVVLAPVAKHYGARTILLWSPAGYALACVVCLHHVADQGDRYARFREATDMPMNYDMHIHTEYCGHGFGMTIDAILRRADELGLHTIAITDHVFRPADLPIISRIRREVEQYETKCRVIIGAEIDVDGDCSDGRLVTDDFSGMDYVVAGFHYVPTVGNYPHCPEDCDLRPDDFLKVWRGSLLGIVSNPAVDTLAHPGRLVAASVDLDVHFDDILAAYAEAAALSAENNVAWEINELTGWRLSDYYQKQWYRLYQIGLDAGVNLIYGSDAHDPSSIAMSDFTHMTLESLPAGCLSQPDDVLKPSV